MNNMQKVSDLQLLVAAFKRVRLETACLGNDNVVISELSSKQQIHLDLLSKQLAQDKYRGASLKLLTPESQEKPSLAVFSERDRVVHTAIAMVIQPILEQSFTDTSWGYIPEHNYLDAVTKITECQEQRFKWLVTASVHDVIDNICQKTLLKLLFEVIPDQQFVDFIDRCLFEKQIENKQMMFGYRVGFGIPQGSPLTALLVHLYLNQFDKNCLAAKLAFVRYAEDFVVMAHSRKEAEKARAIAEQKLTVQQLELNKESIKIVNFEQGFEFWGYRFIGDGVIEQQAKQSPNNLQTQLGDQQLSFNQLNDAILAMPQSFVELFVLKINRFFGLIAKFPFN